MYSMGAASLFDSDPFQTDLRPLPGSLAWPAWHPALRSLPCRSPTPARQPGILGHPALRPLPCRSPIPSPTPSVQISDPFLEHGIQLSDPFGANLRPLPGAWHLALRPLRCKSPTPSWSLASSSPTPFFCFCLSILLTYYRA